MSSHRHFHEHSQSCDCSHHAQPKQRRAGASWTLLGPLLACAFCPVCIGHWAPLVAGVGVGVAFSERQHLAFLLGGLAIAFAPAILAVRRTRRLAALVATTLGATLLLLNHATRERPAIEALGIAALVAGGVLARRARPLGDEPTTKSDPAMKGEST